VIVAWDLELLRNLQKNGAKQKLSFAMPEIER
jgi:hypothetical protein